MSENIPNDNCQEENALQEELKEQNRRLTLLQSLTAHGVSGLTSGKTFDIMVEDVAKALGYKICSLFIPSADGKRLELIARYGDDNVEDIDELNRSGIHNLDNPGFQTTPPYRAFMEGRQIVIHDAPNFPGWERIREVARTLGTTSVAATPLEYGGERLGALIVHSAGPCECNEAELGYLKSVADQVAMMVFNVGLYSRLMESEERHRVLYDSSADWMYTITPDGTIVECNHTMAEALGYDLKEIIGKRIYDFEIEEDRIQARTAITDTIPLGLFSAQRTFLTRSGERISVDLHARVVTTRDGETQWLVNARDVTAQIEAERHMRLLAAAVNNTSDSIIITDTDGVILSINRAGAELVGYEVEEMVGTNANLYLITDDFKEKEIRKVLNEKGAWHGQVEYRKRDGTTIPVHISGAAVSDQKGEPMAFVGISRDITSEQRMTQEILRRNRELAVLNSVITSAANSLESGNVLESSLAALVASMDFDGGLIFLLSNDGQTLRVGANKGTPEDVVRMIGNVQIGKGFAGEIAASRQPIFNDDMASSRFWPEDMPGFAELERPLPPLPPISSMHGVPIVSGGQLMGVLTLASLERHALDDRERGLMLAVARSMGVLIENARLFEDVMRAKAEWESTFDTMTSGVFIQDRNFTILRTNKALADMMGTTVDQLVGRKCYEVFHERHKPVHDCPSREAMATGKNVTRTIHEAHLGAVLHISADPLRDEQGNIIGAVHDVRDITEQEKMRESLIETERLRALGEMASGVAHDFNNFLTVILGNSQLLLSGGRLGTGDRASVETIQSASKNAAETVRRIQEFTRVRTSRKFEPVNINEVIVNSIEVARPKWRDEAAVRGALIRLDLELGDVSLVKGSEAELSEVFVNLILNATDSMPRGGEIKIASAAWDGGVRISISDTGSGMSDDVRKHIFEPFFTTKGPKGSGLGLSLAYGIVKRHGGDIEVTSSEAGGSTFSVCLPAAASPEDDEARALTGAVEAETGLHAIDCEREGAGASVRGRVLVIDDEEMIRVLVRDVVTRMGHRVETAASGSEGLEIYSSQPDFDLVLTDLGMAGMSGWDVVERVKQSNPQTPVALITGWGDQLDPERMKSSGVDLVMAKPFSVAQIKSLVSKVMEGKE